MGHRQREAAQPSGEGDRRRQILRAAINVFARKGYHGTRISDIAQEAKVAYGLVYHYFEDKDALLHSVFEWSWKGFLARIAEVVESEGALPDQLGGVAHVAFEAYRVDPRAVTVLILEIARSPSTGTAHRKSAFTEVITLTSRMFARAQASGELSPDGHPALYAAMLFGAIEMSLTAFIAGLLDATDDAALTRAETQLVETLMRGIEWKPRSNTKLKAARQS